jgi:ubiquinone/menaquinone biosynthesis C-methylase UbiE
VKTARPDAEFVAVDFSPTMLDALQRTFASDDRVTVVSHDLSSALPDLGHFDAVISSFAIHHLVHERKRMLYKEIFEVLTPGGVFCNLEHVSSATQRLHEQLLAKLHVAPADEDPSNKLLDVETQLTWLREIGFDDVDCYWKWREFALLGGIRPI